MVYFRGLYHDNKQPTEKSGIARFCKENIQGSNVIKQMRTTFHDHSTVRADFLEDRFARMRWFLTISKKWAEFVVTDEILRNFNASPICDFKVYMEANAQTRYASRVIPQ